MPDGRRFTKPVGAAVRRFDLPAKAVCQATLMFADTPSSRASPLPHLLRLTDPHQRLSQIGTQVFDILNPH